MTILNRFRLQRSPCCKNTQTAIYQPHKSWNPFSFFTNSINSVFCNHAHTHARAHTTCARTRTYVILVFHIIRSALFFPGVGVHLSVDLNSHRSPGYTNDAYLYFSHCGVYSKSVFEHHVCGFRVSGVHVHPGTYIGRMEQPVYDSLKKRMKLEHGAWMKQGVKT